MGGSGPRMLRLTGEIFEGWLPFSPTPADYATGLRVVREAGLDGGTEAAILGENAARIFHLDP